MKKVALIAPSHIPTQRDIKFLEDILKHMGVAFEALHSLESDPFCPEVVDTEVAYASFKEAWSDDSTEALWAVLGGRMAMRFWSRMDRDALVFTENSKDLIGFSDISSLHLWLNDRGIATWHAPVLACSEESGLGCNLKTSIQRNVLPVIQSRTFSYTGILPVNEAAQGIIQLVFPMTGGNLSSLHYYDSAYGPLKGDHIMMIETEDDYTRIDSILLALKEGDFFSNTKAIIFGSLHMKSSSDPEFEEVQKRCEVIINYFAHDLSIPVFRTKAVKENPLDLQFGHGDYNDPLLFGSDVNLFASEGGFSLSKRKDNVS